MGFTVRTLDEAAVEQGDGAHMVDMKKGVGVLLPKGSRLRPIQCAEDARHFHSGQHAIVQEHLGVLPVEEH